MLAGSVGLRSERPFRIYSTCRLLDVVLNPRTTLPAPKKARQVRLCASRGFSHRSRRSSEAIDGEGENRERAIGVEPMTSSLGSSRPVFLTMCQVILIGTAP